MLSLLIAPAGQMSSLGRSIWTGPFAANDNHSVGWTTYDRLFKQVTSFWRLIQFMSWAHQPNNAFSCGIQTNELLKHSNWTSTRLTTKVCPVHFKKANGNNVMFTVCFSMKTTVQIQKQLKSHKVSKVIGPRLELSVHSVVLFCDSTRVSGCQCTARR